MQATDYMRRAIELAALGLYTTRPNPAVGCVLIKNNRIIGEGWHQKAGQPHAEIMALQQAGIEAKGATAYVTLEPCSHIGKTGPCAEALVKAGIAKVVVAMHDPNPKVDGKGIAYLRAAGIEVEEGLLKTEAESLNQGFIHSMKNQAPLVRLKMAMSLDGRTAMASGESQWISCEQSRLDVQQLRARSGALISGIGTVLADDPLLNIRPQGWYQGEVPIAPSIRVIVDSQLQTPLTAKLFTADSPIWLVCAKDQPEKRQALEAKGAKVLVLPNADGQVDLAALLKALHQAEIHEVLIEAGSRLSGAFIAQQRVHEIWLYMAPILMGDAARGLFHLDIHKMADKIPLQVKDLRAVGSNWRWLLSMKP